MTKEQLREYRDLHRERVGLVLKISELEADIYGPKAQRLDGMPRGGSGGDLLEGRMDEITELLELYRAKERTLARKLLAIEQAIEGLTSRERQLIRLHYIDGRTWEQVCIEMAYSWSQVHRLHRDALAKLREGNMKK